jgi:hypothetical protein
MNLDDIVRAALRKLGVTNPTAAEFADSKQALNIVKEDWGNRGIMLWEQLQVPIILTKDTPSVTLGANVIDVTNVYFSQDGTDIPMEAFSKANYMSISDKKSSGQPNRCYVDWQLAAPVIWTWPVWTYDTGLVLVSGSSYLCTRAHLSDATNAPPNTAYWKDVTTVATATVPWVTATRYDSGVLWSTQATRMQDFSDVADNPDAPARAYRALVWCLAEEIAPEFDTSREYLGFVAGNAEKHFRVFMGGNVEDADLRIFPRLGR